MLILTRRVDEEILIGKEVVLKVLGINGGQVRIGITAKANVPIVRTEIASEEEVSEAYENAGYRNHNRKKEE